MKSLINIFFLCSCFVLIYGQQGDGGNGYLSNYILTNQSNLISLSEPDVNELRNEDEILDAEGNHPWRFGFNHNVQINLENSGSWVTLKNGNQIWFVKIKSKNALTINLTFENLNIPQGNELYVYNPTKSFILGKFTQNHVYEGQLGTELIPGDEVIVEYLVPKNNPIGSLVVQTVTHGYRSSQEFIEKSFGSSGSCNINVNCPQGAAWGQEKKGAVMLVSGSNGFCSGSLVNNVLNDGKPYVLTADHCYSNPASWIFRFQWESATCNNPTNSPSFQSLSGAVLRSRASASDFCLVEITGGLQGGTVPATYTPFFNGWDNSGNIPTSAVGIHHPSGDIKKISFENDPLISTTFGSCPAGSHWGVTWWDEGVTEGGSSGSPLFDQNHHIIGQLHGGASACGASQLSDEYGKFSYSWNPNNSDSTNQLKHWLDPNNSGAQFINGYDPSGGATIQVDPIAAEVGGVNGTFCGAEVSPTVTISNGGELLLTSATITYGFDGTNNLIYNWVGSLPQWQSTTITLPAVTLTNGLHTFNATVSNPNTGVDENNLNNSQNSSFTLVINGQPVDLNLTLDCYGSETSWQLQNSTGVTLFTGSGYQDNAAGLLTENWCLDFGCYVYTINDSYGDGIYGLPWCPESGNVEINYLGDSLTGIASDSSDFGFQAVLNFCLDDNGIYENNILWVNVFPNPTRSSISITSAIPMESFSFYDVTGKKCMSLQIKPVLQSQINLDGLSKGWYVIDIQLENGDRLQKEIIKE